MWPGVFGYLVADSEAGDNKRNRKCEDKHSTESTETSDEFAREGWGRQLSIPVTCEKNEETETGAQLARFGKYKEADSLGGIFEPSVQQS